MTLDTTKAKTDRLICFVIIVAEFFLFREYCSRALCNSSTEHPTGALLTDFFKKFALEALSYEGAFLHPCICL